MEGPSRTKSILVSQFEWSKRAAVPTVLIGEVMVGDKRINLRRWLATTSGALTPTGSGLLMTLAQARKTQVLLKSCIQALEKEAGK